MVDNQVQNELTPVRHVAIVGGGVTGLSLAWYLEQEARQAGLELRYTLLEQSERWGGKVLTEVVEMPDKVRFTVEGGPDSFLSQKPWALELACELGLDQELLGTNETNRGVSVLNRGKPVPLPDGVMLIVPTKFTPFALSPLISLSGKLRMGLDLFIRPRVDDDDETLADFIRRRLGREALNKIAEPLMTGIYNAEAEHQSILATFPRFRQLEKAHGSLIRGMLVSRRNRRHDNGFVRAPLSTFLTFKEGTQALISTLCDRLSGDLRLVTCLTRVDQLASGGYRLHLSGAETLDVDAVIFTTPASVSAELLAPLAPVASAELAAIRYVSTGTISLAFHQSDVSQRLNGFGLVIPRAEARPVNAITISSAKFDNRAPGGYVLLRVFFGGSRSPQSMMLDDDNLLAEVRRELSALLGIEAEPLFHRIYRWWDATPQYDVNHLNRVQRIEAALPRGAFVAGSAYRGPGLPDCIYQARQTATSIVEYLGRL